MKKILNNIKNFFKTDVKIINSYFLAVTILVILVSVGFTSYALFSYAKISNNLIELTVGKQIKLISKICAGENFGTCMVENSKYSGIGESAYNMARFYGNTVDNNYVTLGNDTTKYRIIGVVTSNDTQIGTTTGMIKVIKADKWINAMWNAVNLSSSLNPSSISNYSKTWEYTSLASALNNNSTSKVNVGNMEFGEKFVSNTVTPYYYEYINKKGLTNYVVKNIKYDCYISTSKSNEYPSDYPPSATTYTACNSYKTIGMLDARDAFCSSGSSCDKAGWLGSEDENITAALGYDYNPRTYSNGSVSSCGNDCKGFYLQRWGKLTSIYDYFRGYSGTDYGNQLEFYAGMVRPSFYLVTTLKVTGGDGTINNPYTLSL